MYDSRSKYFLYQYPINIFCNEYSIELINISFNETKMTEITFSPYTGRILLSSAYLLYNEFLFLIHYIRFYWKKD